MNTPVPTPDLSALEDDLLPELTLRDRCDAGECNAAAMASVLVSGERLLFCGHHWRRNEPALTAQGFTITRFSDEYKPF